MQINVPISIGELVDKITILEIKSKKIHNNKKLTNINNELDSLNSVLINTQINLASLDDYKLELSKVNEELWNIEDNIRLFEKEKNFSDEFIKLARSVYITNDKRFEIKNNINNIFNSDYFEEKSYEEY